MQRITWLSMLGVAVFFAGVWHAFADEPRETIRTWTDASGKFRVEATFVEQRSGKVALRKSTDGQVIEVPLDRLSDNDRTFLQDALAQNTDNKKTPRKTESKKSSSSKKSPATIALASADGPWPQWRGPNRDGISSETGLLTSWPESGPPQLWKVKGLGSGFSSVVVAHGKIFTMGKFGNSTKLIALNESDGSQAWATDAGGGGDPNSTPTVDKELAFGLTLDGDLLCAETESGREVWRKSFKEDFGGQMMSGWGYSESVLVDGDRVICTPGAQDAMMAALDRRTGNVIWKTRMPGRVGNRGNDGAGYSSIVISNAAGVKQYVQLVGRGVIGVDATSGELLWGYNEVANGTANIPTPIVKDDYVFCSTGYGDGGTALLKLSGKRGSITPQQVYYLPANKTQNHHGGMILLGNHVYMGHGHNNGFPLCMDLMTGQDVWRPGRGAGSGSAAVAYADGHLYFRYQDGTMALVEATPSTYRLKGQFRIAIHNRESWPHPVIAGGKLYLRDQQELVCYDVRRNPGTN